MTTIETNVMAAVRFVHMTRKLTGATALKVYAFGLSVCGVAVLVSVPHVAANFISALGLGPSAVTAFIIAAVAQTKLVVQLSLLIAMFALGSLGADMLRSIRVTTMPARAVA